MGWFGKGSKKQKQAKKSQKKQMYWPGETCILEPIITPSAPVVPGSDHVAESQLLDFHTLGMPDFHLAHTDLIQSPDLTIAHPDIQPLPYIYNNFGNGDFCPADPFDPTDPNLFPVDPSVPDAPISPPEDFDWSVIAPPIDPTNPPPIVLPVDPPIEGNPPVRFDFKKSDQPLVGIIDTGFNGNNPDIDYSNITLGRDYIDNDANPLLQNGEGNEHGTHVLGVIAAKQDNGIGIDGINDKAPIWLGRATGSGHWADSLVEFVDRAKQSGQPNAVVNLSLDLTQVNPDGSVTTRYEFTPQERSALEYARQNHVLIVAAAGNDGGVMSVLGQASQEFDNIITVGSADGIQRADYSSYGYGLDVMADGGTVEHPVLSTVGNGVGTMAGTSVAAAEVTGAVSQAWAANPGLNYRQVIDILEKTTKDLETAGWDTQTGFGLVDIEKAVELAKATEPQEYKPKEILIPSAWSGEGKVTPEERSVSDQPMTLQWSRQLGTSSNDDARSVATDNAGNVYVTGYTSGSLGGTQQGNGDAWAAKYDSTGTLVWKQQLGTLAEEISYGATVDKSGNLYITGMTGGNLGTANAGQYDAWVAKYDTNGSLLWKQQIGSSGVDYSYGATTDGLGNVYISGITYGSLGGANAGNGDVWIAKYDSKGTLQWKQQLGTSTPEFFNGIAADSTGNVYVTGSTYGSLGGSNAGNVDTWVAKYNSTGSLQWKQQLGTSVSDMSSGVAVDSAGNIYISGTTYGSLAGTNAGSGDVWIAKYNGVGSLQWKRQLGTSGDDNSYGIGVDGAGNAYISGSSDGNAGQSRESWVAQYDSNGNLLGKQTLGSGVGSFTVDSSGNVYQAGATNGNVAGTNAGGSDAWVAKYSQAPVVIIPPDNAGNEPNTARDIGILKGTQTFNDFLGDADAYDYYRFRLDTDSNFNLLFNGVSANNTSANPDFLLLQRQSDGSYTPVGGNNTISNNNAISTGLSAGTYLVRVGRGIGFNGNYNLSLSASQIDAGNTIADARYIGILNSVTQTFHDTIGDADSNDYYRFDVREGSDLHLRLDGLTAPTDVQVLRADGNTVVPVGGLIGSQNAAELNLILSPGTYYARIAPTTAGNNTAYNLSVSATSRAPRNLQINLGNQTYGSGNNIRITGQVYDPDGVSDIDRVWLQLGGKDYYITNFTPSSQDNRWAEFTYDLGRLQPGEYGYAYSAYDKSGSSSGLTISSSNFKVVYSPEDYAGNTPSEARDIGTLNGTQTFSDFVGNTDSEDYYRFTVPSTNNFTGRTNVKIRLDGLSGDAGIALFRLNSDGTKSFVSSYPATGTNPEVINEDLAAGNYVVEVSPRDGSVNTNYNLTLAIPSVGTTSPNQTISSSLSNNDPEDSLRYPGRFYKDYQLTGFTPGENVKLTLNASGFNPYLLLLNSATGEWMAQSVVRTGNSTELEFTVPSDWNNTIRVTSQDINAAGSYTLTAFTPALGSYDTYLGSFLSSIILGDTVKFEYEKGYVLRYKDGSVSPRYYYGSGTPSQPVSNSEIKLVNFSGFVMPTIGVALRNSPRIDDKSGKAEGYGKSLSFDAWTYGETVNNYKLGTPDARWFRIAGTNYWVPSAYINGNPSNSTPMPGGSASSGNTQPQTRPQPIPSPQLQSIPKIVSRTSESGRGKLIESTSFRNYPWVYPSTLYGAKSAGTIFTLLEKVTTNDPNPANQEWYRVRLDSGQEGYFWATNVVKATSVPGSNVPTEGGKPGDSKPSDDDVVGYDYSDDYVYDDSGENIKERPYDWKINAVYDHIKQYVPEYIKGLAEDALNDIVSDFNSILDDIKKFPNVDWGVLVKRIFDFVVIKALGRTPPGRAILAAMQLVGIEKPPSEILAGLWELVTHPDKLWSLISNTGQNIWNFISDPAKAWEQTKQLVENAAKAVQEIWNTIDTLKQGVENLPNKVHNTETEADLDRLGEEFVENSTGPFLSLLAGIVTGPIKHKTVQRNWAKTRQQKERKKRQNTNRKIQKANITNNLKQGLRLSKQEKAFLRRDAKDIWETVTGRAASPNHIHHRIPLEWSHIFKDNNPNDLSNLREVDPITHSSITNEWNAWRRSLSVTPTPEQIKSKAKEIDIKYGSLIKSAN